MKVEVDMELCQSNGLCCVAAPQVFELDDEDILQYEAHPADVLREAVKKAEEDCPVMAITVTDD